MYMSKIQYVLLMPITITSFRDNRYVMRPRADLTNWLIAHIIIAVYGNKCASVRRENLSRSDTN